MEQGFQQTVCRDVHQYHQANLQSFIDVVMLIYFSYKHVKKAEWSQE